jgi:hypothetical protein
MHSHGILLPTIISEAEIREFVEAEGGVWQDHPPLSQGLFDEGIRAKLIVSVGLVKENLSTYTREELAEAEKACGKKIIGHLTVDRSRGPVGAALALRMISKL